METDAQVGLLLDPKGQEQEPEWLKNAEKKKEVWAELRRFGLKKVKAIPLVQTQGMANGQ